MFFCHQTTKIDALENKSVYNTSTKYQNKAAFVDPFWNGTRTGWNCVRFTTLTYMYPYITREMYDVTLL
jgi:hypothetical protein